MLLVHRELCQNTRDHVPAPTFGTSRVLSAAFAEGNSCRIEVAAGAGPCLTSARGIALNLVVTELALNAVKQA